MGMMDKISAAASEAGSSLVTSAKTAASNVTGAITGVGKAAKDAFNNAAGFVAGTTGDNSKSLSLLTNKKTQIDSGFADLFPIGRPCKFNETIDKYQRFGNYLRAKMSVIDLIPVDYGMDLKRIVDLANGGLSTDSKTGKKTNSMFSVGYKTNIELFQRLCKYHGLSGEGCADTNLYAGIRLYTTDDTTANDTIQIQYKDSTFQGFSDKMSDLGQTYRDAATSVLGSETKPLTDAVTGALATAGQELAGEAGGSQGIQELIGGLTSVASDMLLKGNRLTFPKIWQNTSYNNRLSVTIRLVSPYGHPAAIKEFILKPLSYLILLAAPQTINGITYGGNIPITIKAYGMNYTVLGALSSMTFSRGGGNTSFNLYRQPLTIDVSIEFQTLFDAFAIFDPSAEPDKMTVDRNVFKDSMLTSPSGLNLYTSENKNHLMTSLGTILASFRPVNVMESTQDPQVYGKFTPPDRSSIPEAGFSPMTGNLGTTISGAVSSIGKFSEMVTNAPKLIQQGLSNAVYNAAKGSVATIAKTAAGWISKPAAAADAVRNKIMGNLF